MSLKVPPSYSKFPPVEHGGTTQVCCITINQSNLIRLIGTPPELTHPVRLAIQSVSSQAKSQYSQGYERSYHGAHEFELGFSAWTGSGSDAILSRKILVAILKTMAERGWNLIQAVDISKKENDKDAMFFVHTPIPDTLNVEMFAISFNDVSAIRMIDAPEHLLAPIKEAITKHWKVFGVGYTDYKGSRQLCLHDTPFKANGGDTVRSRLMIAQLLATIMAHGYKLYASVDISSGKFSDGRDLDSWVFRRVDAAWQ
ncbi:hypothetical protein BGX27_008349 [Mortierella sp. AM989]|nr:hypothetical protein BGX27_008349 [Mortierella sp. AM989]